MAQSRHQDIGTFTSTHSHCDIAGGPSGQDCFHTCAASIQSLSVRCSLRVFTWPLSKAGREHSTSESSILTSDTDAEATWAPAHTRVAQHQATCMTLIHGAKNCPRCSILVALKTGNQVQYSPMALIRSSSSALAVPWILLQFPPGQ